MYKFPENISFHIDNKVKTPFDTPQAKKQLQSNYKGIVSKDGKWISQIGGWKINVENNIYTIDHKHGNKYYSFSTGVYNQPVNIKLLSMDEYKIVLELTDSEGEPTNQDFAICVSFTSYIPKVALPE